MFAGESLYQDFGEENIGPAPEKPSGSTVYLAWNADSVNLVCVCLVRAGRHFIVARDYARTGPPLDCVREVMTEVRASFPRAKFESYTPAELHDAWQRIALVPALRAANLKPWRGEHVALARGTLTDRIRTTVRQMRLLTVAKDAPVTLNALAAGYKYPIGQTGKTGHEPEAGLSRLAAEALECMVIMLDRGLDSEEDAGGNFAVNQNGTKYRTALPTPRRA